MFLDPFASQRLIASLIIAAFMAQVVPALAQRRGIQGTVTNEEGQPVVGAQMVLELISASASSDDFSVRVIERGQKWQGTTDENGNYFIGVPLSGIYLVTASKESIGSVATQVRLHVASVATANLSLRRAALIAMAEAECSRNTAIGAFERSALSGAGDPALGRLLGWLEAVGMHTAGCNDLPANKVGRWSQREIETLLRDVKQLVTFLQRAQEDRSEAGGRLQRDQVVFFIYNRRFTLDELQRTFYGGETLRPNAMLTRGAVLHADIADFIPGNHGGDPLAEDGGRKGWRPGTMHWEVGRRLIDLVAPSPGDEADAVLWYQAVSAYLLREGRLAEVSAHLARAREVFPEQPVFLLDSAYLHQELSSSAIQAAVQDIRAGGAPVAVRSRRAELQSAERFLRRALAFAPDDAEARLRFGRTLGELGRHEEAAAELRKSIDVGRDRRTLYLGELFLGREEQALGRGDEAKRHFENAAALSPNAQSPLLALGHLARQAGDRLGALRAIRSVGALGSSDADADPWWSYYEPHKQDAEELMARMRNIGSARVR